MRLPTVPPNAARAIAAGLGSEYCMGAIAWSEASAASIRRMCSAHGVKPPPIAVIYPTVVPPGLPTGGSALRPRGSDGVLRLVAIDGQTGVCAQPGRKNIVDAVRAFRHLKALGHRVELSVVAPREPVDSSGGVQLYPFLSRAEIFRLFQQSDVLLFLSRQDSFGYVVMEGMATGACCVATHGPSLPAVSEIIDNGRTGYLIPFLQNRDYPALSARLDFDRLIDVLEFLARNDDVRLRVGQAAHDQFLDGGRFSTPLRDERVVRFVESALLRNGNCSS